MAKDWQLWLLLLHAFMHGNTRTQNGHPSAQLIAAMHGQTLLIKAAAI
jgi:hypothetical protein